jgi:site-specific recombinase XerC
MQQQGRAAPTIKTRRVAIRHLFDWLVTGQMVPVNPADSVRGPSHVIRHPIGVGSQLGAESQT